MINLENRKWAARSKEKNLGEKQWLGGISKLITMAKSRTTSVIIISAIGDRSRKS